MSALTKPESPALSRFFGEHPLQNIRQQMEDTIQSVLGDTSILHSSSGMRPRMDVSETDAEIEVQTDLPGFKPEEVNIQINDNYLMISGSHSEEQKREDQNRQYHCLERRSGSFLRSVLLPCPVRQEDVVAELKEGVLTVTLPKSQSARRQKIPVKG